MFTLFAILYFIRVYYVSRSDNPWPARLDPATEVQLMRSGRKLYARFHLPPQPRCNIIFVHGMWDTSEVWRYTEDICRAENIGYVSVDLAGFGRSDIYADNIYGYERFADDVAFVLEQLKAPKSVVFGHSMGGGVAQVLAAKYPDLISGLFLLSPVAAVEGHYETPNLAILYNALGKYLGIGILYLAHRWAWNIILGPMPFFQRKIDARVRKYHNPEVFSRSFATSQGIRTAMECGGDIAQASSLLSIIDAAKTFTQPAHLVGGSWDKVVSRKQWANLVEYRQSHNLTPVSLKTLSDVGHLPQDEVPDMVIKEFFDFLNSNGFLKPL